MERTLLTIGFDLPGRSESTHEFSTTQSLLDADIILFQPDLSGYRLDSNHPYFQGKRSFDEHSSFEVKEDSQRWKVELSTALEAGKTIFVFFREFEEIYVRTGNQNIAGTGRNARITNIVDKYDNYRFLPLPLPTMVPKKGRGIVFAGHSVFSTLWNEFKDSMEYESYLDSKVLEPLFLTKTGAKPVGGLFKVGRGHIVLLPPITYDEDKFTKQNAKTKESLWTKQALIFGSRLFQIFVDIDKALRRGAESTPPPDWANDSAYQLKQESHIRTDIAKKSAMIEKLMEEKTGLLTRLENEGALRDLLYEKGKPLEIAIISALEVLGYKAEHYNDGNLEMDQVILSPEGERFIGEAEGKDTAAVNIDKFRQLTSNIQEDLEREEIGSPAIGILFGNGYRMTKPSDRAEQFTDKCLNTANSSNCILVRTSDLFPVAKYVRESNDTSFAKACRAAIRSSIGKIVSFPSIPTP
jgi:hypothetical protein